jgi:FKBP-type peptidyl-prolyl cis-trans isomerase SlyD
MKAQVISFNCVLKDPLGRVISSSFNNDILTDIVGPAMADQNCLSPVLARSQPGYSDFHEPIKGLVEGLQGLKKGERRTILVNAERAYGFYDPDLVMKIARKKLPHGEALEIGYQVVTQAKDGECRIFRVIEADVQSVTLDGNHPLAGQDLCFDVEATSTREATPEEIEQARVAAQSPRIH